MPMSTSANPTSDDLTESELDAWLAAEEAEDEEDDELRVIEAEFDAIIAGIDVAGADTDGGTYDDPGMSLPSYDPDEAILYDLEITIEGLDDDAGDASEDDQADAAGGDEEEGATDDEAEGAA